MMGNKSMDPNLSNLSESAESGQVKERGRGRRRDHTHKDGASLDEKSLKQSRKNRDATQIDTRVPKESNRLNSNTKFRLQYSKKN